MVIRICLSMMIFLCCVGAGMVKAQQFGIRSSALQHMMDSLRMLEAKMNYSMDSMPRLIRQCSEEADFPERDFFRRVSSLMGESWRPLTQCWSQALRDHYTHGQLSGEDISILDQLGQELGTTDIQGQRSAFSNAGLRLASQLEDAALEKKNKEKLYRGIGLYIGLLIPLVLM